MLPHPRPSRAPDHLPEPLPNLFLQAENTQKRGYWDASGAMSHKTLDVATKLLMKGIHPAKTADQPRLRADGLRVDFLARPCTA